MEQFEDLTKDNTLSNCSNVIQEDTNTTYKKTSNFKKKTPAISKENILRYFIIFIIISISITFLVLYIKCFSDEEHKQHLIWIWNFVATSNTLTGFFAGLSFTKFISWLFKK
jgi:hypothetical protein